MQPALVHSSNLRLGNQEDEKLYWAPASSYVQTDQSHISSTYGLNSFALQCRCSLFTGLETWVFPTGGLFLWQGGSRRLRMNMQSSQLLDMKSKDLQHEQSGFYPLYIPWEGIMLTEGRFTHTMPFPCCHPAVVLRSHFQKDIFVAWQGNGMVCVNQTWLHCVNQRGKTHSKPLAERHGRGTAWYVWIGLY
jgi:hypothetical protein